MPTNKLAPKAIKPKSYASNGPAMIAGPSADMENKYRAEDALRTLTRANEIRKDRTLMADVKKCANEQMKTLSSVAGKAKR